MATYLIGVDLGGTLLRAVRVDRAGTIYASARMSTAARSGAEAVIAQIETIVREVAAGVPAVEIAGVGVGTPGSVDAASGAVLAVANIAGWSNVPLRALLADRLRLPVGVYNDANAATLGEWRFGGGRGCRNFLFVTLSTGIGGGIISEGRLLLGSGGLAGEVGHMTIDLDGPLCGCGNVGCWEALASGTALARRAHQALAGDAHTRLRELAGDTPVTAVMVAQAAEEGDELALGLMGEEGDLVGVGLMNLLHLYAPERVALGGGVAHSFHLFEPAMRATLRARALPPYREIPIEPAALGANVGLIGAAAALLETLEA